MGGILPENSNWVLDSWGMAWIDSVMARMLKSTTLSARLKKFMLYPESNRQQNECDDIEKLTWRETRKRDWRGKKLAAGIAVRKLSVIWPWNYKALHCVGMKMKEWHQKQIKRKI